MNEIHMHPEPQKANSMNPLMVVGGLLLLGVVGLAAARGTSPASSPSTTLASPTAAPTAAPTEPVVQPAESMAPEVPAEVSESETPATDEVKTIAVEGGSFYYKPNEIRVKQGEKVKIVMTSKDMMHDFTIDELNVKMPVVKSGTTGTVEFTATTKGTFEYYCSVGQHRANGQVGKLIVE